MSAVTTVLVLLAVAAVLAAAAVYNRISTRRFLRTMKNFERH